jgi:hypothetical protein
VIDPDAQAFADAYAADPTDDDTLDHHAARLAAVDDASMYLDWMIGFALVDGYDRDWLDVEAAALKLDMEIARMHPAPDWRQFQETVWTGRLDDTLRASVAFA